MTRRRAVVAPLVLVAAVELVALVVAGVGNPWPARAGIRTIAVNSGLFRLVVDSATGRAFLNGTNSLQVLDIATGALLHRTTLPLAPSGGWPAQVVPDERSGRAFAIVQSLFGPGADQVAMLDAASGQQVRTLHLPAGSHAAQVVVDERRGRAYVLLTPATGRTVTVLALDATSGHIVRTLTLLTAGPLARGPSCARSIHPGWPRSACSFATSLIWRTCTQASGSPWPSSPTARPSWAWGTSALLPACP